MKDEVIVSSELKVNDETNISQDLNIPDKPFNFIIECYADVCTDWDDGRSACCGDSDCCSENS